jgi:hypothetical protein
MYQAYLRGLSLTEVGALYGVGPERVRQVFSGVLLSEGGKPGFGLWSLAFWMGDLMDRGLYSC